MRAPCHIIFLKQHIDIVIQITKFLPPIEAAAMAKLPLPADFAGPFTSH
jgi:hypothetical protein